MAVNEFFLIYLKTNSMQILICSLKNESGSRSENNFQQFVHAILLWTGKAYPLNQNFGGNV